MDRIRFHKKDQSPGMYPTSKIYVSQDLEGCTHCTEFFKQQHLREQLKVTYAEYKIRKDWLRRSDTRDATNSKMMRNWVVKVNDSNLNDKGMVIIFLY